MSVLLLDVVPHAEVAAASHPDTAAAVTLLAKMTAETETMIAEIVIALVPQKTGKQYSVEPRET